MAASRAQQAAIAISMKKAGKKPKSLPKAQFGNTGPGGTTVKSNIGPKIAGAIGAGIGAIGTAITVAKAKKAKKQAAKVKEDVQKEVAEKGRYGGAKKSLSKAQSGKQVSDSVFNKKYNPDPGFFKTPPKDWNPKDIDPGFSKGPKGNYTPKKPKLSKDGHIQYKKGGSIDILFSKKAASKKKRVNDPGFAVSSLPKVKNNDPGFAAKSSGYKGKAFKEGGSTPAWQRKEGKSPSGGLNAKGVASYRAANPGSKLQTAVTTKPSKLKAGSKDAKRRKSFCARMSGMPGPMKDEKGRPTRKALSLRKWNC